MKIKLPSILFLIIALSCNQNPENNSENVNIEISVAFKSDYSPISGSILALFNADGSFMGKTSVTSSNTYTFDTFQSGEEVKVIYFSDLNSNSILDSNEEYTSFNLGTFNSSNYPQETLLLELVYYSGEITLHSDWDSSNGVYILCKNSYLGSERVIPINSGGTFSFFDLRMEDKQNYNLYLFRDDNGDGKYSWNSDKVSYLVTENGYYSNTFIIKKQVKISGDLDVSAFEADGIYQISGNKYPIIKLTDQSFWVDMYQNIDSNYSFYIYTFQGHSMDLKLGHLQSLLPNTSTTPEEYLQYPVRLAGPTSYSDDTVIYGVTDGVYNTDRKIRIHKVTLNITDNTTLYQEKPLFIKVGQYPFSYEIGTGSRGNKTYIIGFRDFDRTTSTDGTFNDENIASSTTGYGGYLKFESFIDHNHSGSLNPGEPTSGIFFFGDTDGDKTATWGANETGDWNDTFSNSFLIENIQVNLSIN